MVVWTLIMNWRAITALVILLGIAGTIAYFSPAPQPEGPKTITITYTNDGFIPADVHIHQGDSIVFVNENKRPFWPASGAHPTHTLYPVHTSSDCLGSAFDACKAIPTGGSWQFTFDAIGEWSYHDHLNAGNIGFITVTK